MNDLAIACLGVPALIGIWGLWKSARLAVTRDEVFRLRDEARAFFAARPRGLEDTAYLELRRFLNANLRWAEHLRFMGMLYLVSTISDEAREFVREEIQRRFYSPDPEVRRFVDGVRRSAIRKMQKYMLLTSTLGLLVLALSLLLGIPALLAHRSLKALKDAIAETCDRVRPMGADSLAQAAMLEAGAASAPIAAAA
jgi:hypothetical protein